jgi:glycosyl-4,4'-diaponeurosporenoate acyltransferase
MTVLVWALNLLGWPVIHFSIASGVVRLPSEYFVHDCWLTAPRCWERHGGFYREWFAIRKWKSWLPDGASWLGGFGKKKLRSRNPTYLTQFLIETRRAEIAHWCMIACLPIFFLWNPPWACWVMSVYALAANLPCILVQRYNRLVLDRVARTRRRALATAWA